MSHYSHSFPLSCPATEEHGAAIDAWLEKNGYSPDGETWWSAGASYDPDYKAIILYITCPDAAHYPGYRDRIKAGLRNAGLIR